MVAGGPDNPAPLYRSGHVAHLLSPSMILESAADKFSDPCRQCVHPRIPQMAVVGYAESGSSIYPYEMMAKWVAHLLDGAVRLPGVADMERSVA